MDRDTPTKSDFCEKDGPPSYPEACQLPKFQDGLFVFRSHKKTSSPRAKKTKKSRKMQQSSKKKSKLPSYKQCCKKQSNRFDEILVPVDFRDKNSKKKIFRLPGKNDDIEAQFARYRRSLERGEKEMNAFQAADSLSRVKIYLCLFMLFASILTIVFINAVAFQAVKKLKLVTSDSKPWNYVDFETENEHL